MSKYRLANPFGARKVGVDLDLDIADESEAAVDFGDDAMLFGEGWEGE